MTRLTIIAFGLGMFASSSALAAERTITLAVQNMFCADCPFIVRKSLEGVPGVAKATVSFKDKTAIVTYDDGRTDIKNLIEATTNAGFPSAPKS
jgi:periplasmic mercuric ion binding protein